jgi:hypothetical protein
LKRARLNLGLRVSAFKDVSVGLTFFPYPKECEHYYEQRLKEYKKYQVPSLIRYAGHAL